MMRSHYPLLLDSLCDVNTLLSCKRCPVALTVSASLLAHLGAEWLHFPVMLVPVSAPLIVSPSSLSFSCASCRGTPQPLQSCWMTSTLWSGCCAVFPLTAQGAGQCPWMPRWRITCTSAPTTCASSGTGCAQARMTPSASTVPLTTKLAAATTLAGLTALLIALLAVEPTCSFFLFTLRLCDLHLVAWMGLVPDCLVAVALTGCFSFLTAS